MFWGANHELHVSRNWCRVSISVEHCGKRGHRRQLKNQRKAFDGKDGKGDGKGGKSGKDRKGKPSGKKGGGKNPDAKGAGKGGKPEKKDTRKKKKKGNGGKTRAMTGEPESEASSATSAKGSVMGLFLGMGSWFGGQDLVLSPLKDRVGTKNPERPEAPTSQQDSRVSRVYPLKGSVGTLAVRSSRVEVERLCTQESVDLRDMWLVDCGATCHVVSQEFLSSVSHYQLFSQSGSFHESNTQRVCR